MINTHLINQEEASMIWQRLASYWPIPALPPRAAPAYILAVADTGLNLSEWEYAIREAMVSWNDPINRPTFHHFRSWGVTYRQRLAREEHEAEAERRRQRIEVDLAVLEPAAPLPGRSLPTPEESRTVAEAAEMLRNKFFRKVRPEPQDGV